MKLLTTLNKNPRMLRPRRITHLKHTILQTRRLRRRPMNAQRRRPRRNTRRIKHHIPNLTIEHIRSTKLQSIRSILIAVYQPKAGEACGGFEDGEIVRVADDLRVVVVDEGGGDDVGPGGEIDDCWGGGR